jgi:hypothetical protein
VVIDFQLLIFNDSANLIEPAVLVPPSSLMKVAVGYEECQKYRQADALL